MNRVASRMSDSARDFDLSRECFPFPQTWPAQFAAWDRRSPKLSRDFCRWNNLPLELQRPWKSQAGWLEKMGERAALSPCPEDIFPILESIRFAAGHRADWRWLALVDASWQE